MVNRLNAEQPLGRSAHQNDGQSISYDIYNGETYSAEDHGNIHYGYVGSVAFAPIILEVSAGANQFRKGVHWEYFSTYFDEPRDNEMIRYGIELFNRGL